MKKHSLVESVRIRLFARGSARVRAWNVGPQSVFIDVGSSFKGKNWNCGDVPTRRGFGLIGRGWRIEAREPKTRQALLTADIVFAKEIDPEKTFISPFFHPTGKYGAVFFLCCFPLGRQCDLFVRKTRHKSSEGQK